MCWGRFEYVGESLSMLRRSLNVLWTKFSMLGKSSNMLWKKIGYVQEFMCSGESSICWGTVQMCRIKVSSNVYRKIQNVLAQFYVSWVKITI